MIPVTCAPACSNVAAGGAASGAARAGQMMSLLRPPSVDFAGLGGVQDALSLLYADRVKQGALDIRSVDTQARQQQRATEAQQKKLTQAIAEQRSAERASKGFWADLKKVASTVAKIATVVASAAAVVMSGGAAAGLAVGVAGLVLSGGGMAVRELKLLGKDSESVGLGMELAGAAIGIGACVAGAIQVGAATKAATLSPSATATWQSAKTAARITAAVGTATSATAGVVVADYARDADLAAADAAEARGVMETQQRQLRLVVETLQAAQEAQRDALSGTIDAINACNNATAVAIAGVRG